MKGKTKKLKNHLLSYIKDKKPLSKHITEDKARGRIDIRAYYVYDLRQCTFYGNWEHINTITVVQRSGIRDQKPYIHKAYYLSNLIKDASTMAPGIRGHWSIENELHRCKDVFQLEDKNYIKSYQLSRNVSVLQTLTMNIIRLFVGSSIKFANEKYANRIKPALALFSNQLQI